MSYDFNVSDPSMVGTFNSTYTVPLTLGCWIEYANHPESVDYALTLHKDANLDEFISLQASGTADRLDARQSNSSGSDAAFHTSRAGEYDGVWLPWVGTFESTSVWNIFVELITNTNARSASRNPGSIGKIVVGTSATGAADWVNKIAECAIWNSELSNADIILFLAVNPASGIDAANLIGYWPLDVENSTQNNEGTDSAGDLTVTAATFDADHPPIISGGAQLFSNHLRQLQSN